MNTIRLYLSYFTIAILFIVGFSKGAFFLPALPSIGKSFHTDRSIIQLTYPLILFGSALSYTFTGTLSDAYGAKKILVIQLSLFVISLIICRQAQSTLIFLCGILLNGIGSFIPLVIKYIKTNLPNNTIKALSLFMIIGTISFPLNATLVGHLLSLSTWRTIFSLWIVLALICAALTCLLTQKPHKKLTTFKFTAYLNQFKYFITNRDFQKYLIIASTNAGAASIFFTLSPHICIVDLHLAPKAYAMLLFIPTAGSLIGYALDIFLITKLSQATIIIIGQYIAVFALIIFTIIFNFYPNPITFMSPLALFMVSYSLIGSNTNTLVMSIKTSLAGAAIGFFSVGVHLINGAAGTLAAHHDGETMGILMLIFLVFGLVTNLFSNRKRTHPH